MFPNYSISFIFHGITICREPEKNIDDVYLCDTLNGCFLIEQVRWTMYTKGTVLLVCFLCGDIGACIETCRRHVPTLWCDLRPRLLWLAWIIAYYQGSHGFNEIQQEDYLWKFVVVCGRKKSLQQNVRLIRGICGFLGKPQISTNFHELFCGLNGLFLNNFTYLCQ